MDWDTGPGQGSVGVLASAGEEAREVHAQPEAGDALGRGWKALVDSADKATTFEELRAAGERFGRVMGANTARILFMLATAAIGGEANLANVAPTLPGAAQASRLVLGEGSVALDAVGAVESVVVAEAGLTIVLAP